MPNIKYLLLTLALWGLSLLLGVALNPIEPPANTSQINNPILLVALVIFGIQWLAFIPAYIFQTERYYDLIGSVTYITAAILAISLAGQEEPLKYTLILTITIWAVRLGSFLFLRVMQQGGDDRFDRIKPNFMRFFMVWNIQGLWIFITLACALAAIGSQQRYDSNTDILIFCFGLLIWAVGFSIEVIADRQKSNFKKDPSNKGKFIQTGLWSRSRHPNYCGEIILWFGVAIAASPLLSGWQWLGLISPIFVYLLLTRVSGIPLLEAKAEKNWGEDEYYLAYKANTSILWLR